MRITLAESDHAVIVRVWDAGASTRPLVRDAPHDEGGRGLLIVEEISQCWGVAEDQAGRTVWCEVKC